MCVLFCACSSLNRDWPNWIQRQREKKTPKQLKLSFQYVAYTNNLLLVYYFSTKYEHFLFLKRVENPPMLTLTKNVDNAAILC